jgi:S1-C subfamily serine protease
MGRTFNAIAPALAALLLLAPAAPAAAQTSLEDLVAAVVRIKTFIHPDGRTIGNLGREREGSGIVIDESGLILTIGYLMVEAHAAEVVAQNGRTVPANVVGYDHETGFGLLRTLEPLKVKPLGFGRSADLKQGDPVLALSYGGAVLGAHVAARREFAGEWEYLLDEAIFTSPPHPAWSGAALIARDGRLVGVGSLIVGDATGKGEGRPGNMFVPIDRLPPILADLIADGRPSGAGRPWLGVTTSEAHGKLLVSRVVPGSPAEKAGLRRGDVIVGVHGDKPSGLADFYRKVWARGPAGAVVALDVLQNDAPRRVEVQSIDRLDHLKLKSTF